MTDKRTDRKPDTPGGTPEFSGTMIPVGILMARLRAGDQLEDLVDDYPKVTQDELAELLRRPTTLVLGGSDDDPA